AAPTAGQPVAVRAAHGPGPGGRDDRGRVAPAAGPTDLVYPLWTRKRGTVALTSEQEWILVGCGLIAHADEILDIGEWDEVLRYVGSALSEHDQLIWMEILSRQEQLERRFAVLP